MGIGHIRSVCSRDGFALVLRSNKHEKLDGNFIGLSSIGLLLFITFFLLSFLIHR